ncbi:MAG TPA: hypothetical protein EYN64_00640 [Flavobacteriales bacterium]|nr:hypothetical protein [Flavobacteriales bacterium]
MTEARYATRDILQKANDFALKKKFNRCVDPMFIKELPDDDTRYPVTFVMLHNDSQIRTSFYIPENIFESITIDLDPAAFIRLPKIEIGSPEKN